MSVVVEEQEIVGIRWLVLRGSRSDVFTALGRVARDEILALTGLLPEGAGMRRWVADGVGAANYARVVDETTRRFPTALGELASMALGAGVELDTLLLANVRGDVGSPDGTGCSDLGWRGAQSIIAHNEDAAPPLERRLMFVTLLIDDEPAVTAQWYPGFLPSNALTVTGRGLVWGVDHIQVNTPGRGAGRHFVMRAAQSASSVAEVLRLLESQPMAGGFAVTVGSTAERSVANVESAAGLFDAVELGGDRPFTWHTNHLRRLPASIDTPTGDTTDDPTRQLGGHDESRSRGGVLARLTGPAAGQSDEWFLRQLTGPGVFRTAAGGDPLMTVCTSVANLTENRLILRGVSGATAQVSLSDFAEGRYVASS